MATLNMNGPYELSTLQIDKLITKKSAGNYALGYSQDGSFYVLYVGRSDSDLRARLHSWIGENAKYKRFMYSYAESPKSAFEKECHNYHDFGGKAKLDNEVHPDRPENSGWKCPRCKIFDWGE
ncbi:MAG: hypothetical protein KAK00_06320 [Nanoarchaeota archaeon]|nr:hypothetical protein [Nanoarchaeota archaeon]